MKTPSHRGDDGEETSRHDGDIASSKKALAALFLHSWMSGRVSWVRVEPPRSFLRLCIAFFSPPPLPLFARRPSPLPRSSDDNDAVGRRRRRGRCARRRDDGRRTCSSASCSMRAPKSSTSRTSREMTACVVLKVRPLKDWASSQASIWIWGGRTVARDRTAGCTPREHAPPGKAPARSDSRRRPRRCPRARARRRRRSGGRGGGGGGGGAACSRGGVAPPRPRRRRCRCGRARH